MMIFNAVWAICVFLILLWVIGRFKIFGHRRVHPVLFQIIFIVKVAAGIVMTLIYSNFYTDRSTADIFKYFDDSRIMVSALTEGHPKDFFKMVSGIDSRDPDLDVYYRQMNSWDERESLYNDSRIVIRLNAVLHAVSFGNYYIHMMVMCFLTTFGLTCIFQLLAQQLNEKFMLIYFSVFCLPSVVFWYSGMLKDGLLITALGLFMWLFLSENIWTNRYLKVLLLSVLFVLLLFLKTYILIIVLPGLLLLKLSRAGVRSVIFISAKWITVYALWILVLLGIGFVFPRFNFVDMMALKQHNFFLLAKQMKAGSYFHINEIKSFADLIVNAPQAFFNVMFRPFIYENRSPVVLMAAIENILIVAAGIYALVYRKRIATRQYEWLLFSIVFVVLLYVLIGLVVPVAGALVRYKVTALPFLFLIFVIIVDKEKAKKHLRLFRIIK